MPAWFLYTVFSLFFVLAATALFFFTVTRGALIMRGVMAGSPDDAAHVYPIYSNMRLIRMIDFQPIIAAILLFQYDRLVSAITHGLQNMNLRGKNVLITSCAFGNVIPRVVTAAIDTGARRVLIADIIKNELDHAQGKLLEHAGKIEFLEENATAMKQGDGTVAANVIFFLLHELPHHLKGQALKEATRVLAPGGKLYLAEFHKPDLWVLRALSWTYFKVFEPLGLALWDTHDPLKQLEALGGFSCERRTVFFGNFQIIVATKDLPA
ncbi:MAG: class I SAM-dependent methyltransferase [Rhodoferax sp.]|uniref:class I SAM-dependent methyltransferase n=1 Tax=Rhodoferax sp. TaxID=50421 RepID=UPI002627B032|nr:class I SAM-dependent methyltransferase [Rhodoferax sp.]MDD5335899.1 class I SAM-dependent methyltransferase [Rhodoferax sp.]